MKGNLALLIPVLLPILVGLIMALWRDLSIKTSQYIVAGTAFVNLIILLLSLRLGHELLLLQISDSLAIHLKIDEVGLIFVILISVIWVLASLVAVEYMSHEVNVVRFNIFFIVSLGAMVGVASSANLFSFYLFYEAMTLVSYPLVINQGTPEAKKAGVQYLAYSLIGAALTLLAIMVVNNVASSNEFVAGGYLQSFIGHEIQGLLVLVYFFAIIGYGAKAGLYPMHAWLPKAHPVAPAPASALLSGIITKAGVLGIIRMTYYVFGPEIVQGTWAQKTLLILIVLTIFLGSMLAFKARQLKVRLAYSSVSQVSYVLLGILVLNAEGLTGALLQVLSHAMIKNLLFLTVGAIIFKTGKTYVDEIQGEGKTMPLTMIAFTIGSLSLIGIPPLSGFISKYYLAMGSLAVENDIFGISAIIILILSSMLTAGYLLPLVIKAFFPVNEGAENTWPDQEPTSFMTIPFLILTVGIVMLGAYPDFMLNFIRSLLSTLV